MEGVVADLVGAIGVPPAVVVVGVEEDGLERESIDDFTDPTRTRTSPAARVENLRDRLAEMEARLERARAKEAELSRQLEEMKRFVCVMEILESYLKRRYGEKRKLEQVKVNYV
ncbi:uncharacterized protein LOC132060507 [Lycium ferocissimum]|uniref:uncharacterized protein LOC132060507 n=1 Tax=Lycium ferocissimum TaxID=112874 RepID=UPI0028153758|nr:uncharacterized protein LOC132060507 [Lycium ferocissimum]